MLHDALRDWQLAELAAADAELRASRTPDGVERAALREQAHALRCDANEALDRLLERHREGKAAQPQAPAGGLPALPGRLLPR